EGVAGRAVVVDHRRAVCGTGHNHDRSDAGTVIAKGVVGQDVERGRAVVLRQRDGVVLGVREVVDQGDIDLHRSGIEAAIAVDDLEGEGVRPVVVDIGGVHDVIVGGIVRRGVVVAHGSAVGRRGDDQDGAAAGAVTAEIVIGQHVQLGRAVVLGHVERVI